MSNTFEDFIAQYVSPFIGGAAATALTGTLADEFQRGQNLQVAVGDQLFVCTASSPYLYRRLSELGINVPYDVGINDQVLQEIGITVTATKQVVSVMQSVLEVFYGPNQARAWTQSTQSEPYAIGGSMDLILSLDDGSEHAVYFSADDFQDPSAASAAEVAEALTQLMRQLGYPNALSLPYVDPNTGLIYVRVYGSASGSYSAVTILGGEVQSVLQFPNMRNTVLTSNDTVWQITKTGGQTFRFRWDGGSAPVLSAVLVGDVAMIYGPQFEAAGLGGSFEVTAVSIPGVSPSYSSGYFEVTNAQNIVLKAVPAGTVPPPNVSGSTYSYAISQVNYADLEFFEPVLRVTNDNITYAAAYEPGNDTLKVYMPATTQVVQRSLVGGWYAHALFPYTDLQGTFGSSTIQANQVQVVNDYVIRFPSNLADNSGSGGILSYGGGPTLVEIDYVYRYGGYEYVRCAEPHGVVGIIQWSTSASYTTGNQVAYAGFLWTALQNSGFGYGGAKDPSAYPTFWKNSGYVANYSAAVVTISSVTVRADAVAPAYTSGYAYDLAAPFNLTGYQVVLRTPVLQGQNPNTILVTGTLPQPSGYLILDLSEEEQEVPVQYLSAVNQGPPQPVGVSSASQNGFSIVVTTTVPHGQVPGEHVTLSGTGSTNGTYEITAVPSPSVYEVTSLVSQVALNHGGTSSPVNAPSVSLLTLSPTYSFKRSHAIGANVTLLSATTACVPNPLGTDYPTYATDTGSATQFAQDTIQQVTALGIKNVQIIIVYPGDIGWGNANYPSNQNVTPHSDAVRIFGPADDQAF